MAGANEFIRCNFLPSIFALVTIALLLLSMSVTVSPSSVEYGVLCPGMSMTPGTYLESANGLARLQLTSGGALQVVIFPGGAVYPITSGGTAVTGASSCQFTTAGIFTCIGSTPAFSTNPNPAYAPLSVIVIRDDGNVVQYSAYPENGQYELVYWSSNTNYGSAAYNIDVRNFLYVCFNPIIQITTSGPFTAGASKLLDIALPVYTTNTPLILDSTSASQYLNRAGTFQTITGIDSANIRDIASSSDASIVYLVTNYVWKFENNAWTQVYDAVPRKYCAISTSLNGVYVTVGILNGPLLYSSNKASNFQLAYKTPGVWTSITTAYQQYVYVADITGGVLVSNNYGAPLSFQQTTLWGSSLEIYSLCTDQSGEYAYAGGKKIWKTTDYGATWNEITDSNNVGITSIVASHWKLACSFDENIGRIYAAIRPTTSLGVDTTGNWGVPGFNSPIYGSIDFGFTWRVIWPVRPGYGYDIATNRDGTYLYGIYRTLGSYYYWTIGDLVPPVPTSVPTSSSPTFTTFNPTSSSPTSMPSSMLPTLSFRPTTSMPSGRPSSSRPTVTSQQPSTSAPSSSSPSSARPSSSAPTTLTRRPSTSTPSTSRPSKFPSSRPTSIPSSSSPSKSPVAAADASISGVNSYVAFSALDRTLCDPVEFLISISVNQAFSYPMSFKINTPGLTTGGCTAPASGSSISAGSVSNFQSSLQVTASWTSTTLTVTAIQQGMISIGMELSATGMNPGTKIVDFGTGLGGLGTYILSVQQTSSGSGTVTSSKGTNYFSVSYVEGSYTDHFEDSYILLDLVFFTGSNIIPNQVYTIKFDRSNGFRMGCSLASSWSLQVLRNGIRPLFVYSMPLKYLNIDRTICFAYKASLNFDRAQLQFPTSIDLGFNFAIRLQKGDSIKVYLPGFTNSKKGLALPYNDLSSSNSQTYVTGTTTSVTVKTNIATPTAIFSASWTTTSTTLLISSISVGYISAGQILTGTGISEGTTIVKSGSGTEYSVAYNGPYDTLIPGKRPWGIYRAEDFNPTLNLLPEARANGLNAITTGSIEALYNSGNGAAFPVHWLSGGISSTITWPKYAFVEFTICTCTRYTSNDKNILIGDATKAWFHGHYRGIRGVAFYENDVTLYTQTVGVNTDWLVMCGKGPKTVSSHSNTVTNNANGVPTTPEYVNSILVDGVPSGYYGPGSAPYELTMNKYTSASYAQQSSGSSTWGFKDLVIWDRMLSDAEMALVSQTMIASLAIPVTEPLSWTMSTLQDQAGSTTITASNPVPMTGTWTEGTPQLNFSDSYLTFYPQKSVPINSDFSLHIDRFPNYLTAVCGSPLNYEGFRYEYIPASSAYPFKVGQPTSGSATFIASWTGAVFVASWVGTTLTVSSVTTGAIAVGQKLSGSGLIAGTYVKAFISGTGGTGLYHLSVSHTNPGTTVTITATSLVLTVSQMISGTISLGQIISGTGITAGTSISSFISGSGGVGTYMMSQTQVASQTNVEVTASGASILVASWTGTTLTITSVTSGALAVGHVISGYGITTGTSIIAKLSGNGGAGSTYTMSASQASGSGWIVSYKILPVPFQTSDVVGQACGKELGQCNGNGVCDYCTSSCKCFDGFGSPKDLAAAQSLTFTPDCLSMACPTGPALVQVPKKGKSLHKMIECSNNGICFRGTGSCKCFSGYSGPACDRKLCPFAVPAGGARGMKELVCGGRGSCLSMENIAKSADAQPLLGELSIGQTISGSGIPAGTKITSMMGLTAANFTARWTGTTLTVMSVFSGTIDIGQTLIGSSIDGSKIVSKGTGTGGAGTYQLSASFTANNVNKVVSTSYTGGGGIGTYGISALPTIAGTNGKIISSSNALVTATWTTTSKTLTVVEAYEMEYSRRKNKYTTSWDAELNYGCVCDSSWPVGLGNGETQQSEYFGAACQYRHCPSGDDPLTVLVNETNCFGLSVIGSTTLLGAVGNLCHYDCSGRGLCDYSSGQCACFPGFMGDNCGILDTYVGATGVSRLVDENEEA